ncbi:hypothetical protein NQ318_013396 [Aromia moschata]|uniref:Helix-turn-helix domain-containing protein n=1 Tax=Aromia moschata TaxID=1265417 RepID=A0AAV8XZK5_9CUCU|nr:hypothetical protein NQ318_013396 [Aromia moschata]
MGNSLSPFIANLFMSKFETEVKDKFEYFSRVWFRKETATLRYIPNDSHHPFQYKMASFNFLIHRLLNFPLSKERFEHEKQLIKSIAKNNGYSVHLIDKFIRKHTFKRTLYNSTTLRRDTDNSKFALLPYEPKFTRGLDKIFIIINLVYNSNKLQTLLGNPKDKIDNKEKFKEHMAHLKYGRTEKSCVAQHAFDNKHRIDINNLKLIRNVTNSRQLDAFESLEIIKCNSSMNTDNGPIPTSPLFALINKDNANLVGETCVDKRVVPVPTPGYEVFREVFPDAVIHFDHCSRSANWRRQSETGTWQTLNRFSKESILIVILLASDDSRNALYVREDFPRIRANVVAADVAASAAAAMENNLEVDTSQIRNSRLKNGQM